MLLLFAGALFFFWMFNLSSLPLSTAELRKLSNGEDLLDVRLYYTAQEAFRAMDRYGASGRAWYFRFLAVDFVFLSIYGFAFSLFLTRMTKSLFDQPSPWNKVNLLPFGIALADCCENICILTLLVSYPEQNLVVGTLAGTATLIKWLLTVITLLCLTVAIIFMLAKRIGFKIHASIGREKNV